MKKLIIHGNPGVRKGGVIEYDGEGSGTCSASTSRARVARARGTPVWCTIGKDDERETFQYQDFIPMHLETENVDAEAVDVIRRKTEARERSFRFCGLFR